MIRIHTAIEAAAEQCVRELNESGHAFVADDDAVFEWVDEVANQMLSIDCALGVSVSQRPDAVPTHDPQVEKYLAIAESGDDRMATVLNNLEGDVANGGFLQLLENKGLAFFREAIDYLELIGAAETAAIVKGALELINANSSVFAAYESLTSEIYRLDARFYDLSESIAALYLQHMQQDEA
jgi:hypothetical protein